MKLLILFFLPRRAVLSRFVPSFASENTSFSNNGAFTSFLFLAYAAELSAISTKMERHPEINETENVLNGALVRNNHRHHQ